MRQALCTMMLAAVLGGCGGSGGDDPAPPANPHEPNDSLGQATPIALGDVVVARIATAPDVDFYRFTVPAGGAVVRVQTFDAGGVACDPTNAGVDPFIEVYAGNGSFVAGDDDSGIAPWCDDLSASLPAGTGYVMVGGNADARGVTAFDYALKVTIP